MYCEKDMAESGNSTNRSLENIVSDWVKCSNSSKWQRLKLVLQSSSRDSGVTAFVVRCCSFALSTCSHIPARAGAQSAHRQCSVSLKVCFEKLLENIFSKHNCGPHMKSKK
jgi:hypothetical protein